ncbi:molybdate ABC transporter substrate-binding protein [Arthrobacter russicus]|uniref:Molybdate transport system substrate-binding protein n=1 Tax=Arthrobacter russicus TaxID=172040 RepID=A0ABU1JF37_9MICC|nr:molybdate ABC transporter substrate-binding protein [Arthrobacter russicus]MDR6270745.1 molybdate transport system substrate-binding protein [Arthrobacter russicus]
MKLLRARPAAAFVLAAAVLPALAACGGSAAAPSDANSSPGTASGATGQITVFAAASLTDVMKTLTEKYRQENPGIQFTLSYAASSALVQQLTAGAAADVLVTADEASIASIPQDTILAPGTTIIASNEIVLAIAPGNPGKISTLEDATKDSKIAVCAPAVPCGRAAQRVLDAAKLTLSGASQENDVSAVRTKVSTGQVDAGFVYSTDAKATAGQGVTSVKLDDPSPNKYPLAITKAAADKPEVLGFKTWLAGQEAAGILAAAGFGPGAAGNSASASPSGK